MDLFVIFFHFEHSKPLKQPKIPQILSQNRTKTTGSNDLAPMIRLGQFSPLGFDRKRQKPKQFIYHRFAFLSPSKFKRHLTK